MNVESEKIRDVTFTCNSHGDFPGKEMLMPFSESDWKRITTCPKCAEESKQRAIEEAKQLAEEQLNEKIGGILNRIRLPLRFKDRTLESYIAENPGQQKALKSAERFVERFDEVKGLSMIFCGKPGTGKTHLAAGIAVALAHKLRGSLFCSVLKAIRSIKETYHKDSEETESDAIDYLLAPNLLILDEVGVQVGSEHEKMLLFEVINERYQNCRSTILISNLNAKELSEYLGDRVMDRFREGGAVIAFDWVSHRGTK